MVVHDGLDALRSREKAAKFSREKFGIFCLAVPYDQHAPTERAEFADRGRVARSVARKFWPPVSSVGFGNARIEAF